MMTVNDLLDATKEATGATSDNQLAEKIGVVRSAISNYRHGRASPDPVTCAAIAGYTGIPLARVLGIVGEARAISREEKAVWRKLAATAVSALLIMSAALPLPTTAKPLENAAKVITVPAGLLMYYAKRNGWLWTLRAWLAWKLRRSKPGPGNKEVFAC